MTITFDPEIPLLTSKEVERRNKIPIISKIVMATTPCSSKELDTNWVPITWGRLKKIWHVNVMEYCTVISNEHEEFRETRGNYYELM